MNIFVYMPYICIYDNYVILYINTVTRATHNLVHSMLVLLSHITPIVIMLDHTMLYYNVPLSL